MTPDRSAVAAGATVVIKVGSSSVTGANGSLDTSSIQALVKQVFQVHANGFRPILVSSGAVAAGLGANVVPRAELRNGLPSTLTDRQALAAIGQTRMMHVYEGLFAGHGIQTAQLLLSSRYMGLRSVYLSMRRTLSRLIALRIVPILNENDAVTLDDQAWPGENDRLAALVAGMLEADLLILLTDQPGLYNEDPRLNPSASLFEVIKEIDDGIRQLAKGTSRASNGTGGMATKVAAADIASWSGIPCVIAQARDAGVILAAIDGHATGTFVAPRRSIDGAKPFKAREAFIAFAPSRGRLTIDHGAAQALTAESRKSLLAVGVQGIDGKFDVNDVVEIVDTNGELLARGLAAESADRLRQSLRESTTRGVVAVHADDMLLDAAAIDPTLLNS